MGGDVVQTPGASPYTRGFKAARCRHLTETQLLDRSRKVIEELKRFASDGSKAAELKALYQQWASLLQLSNGAGYRWIDKHHDDLKAKTDAVVAALNRKRDLRRAEEFVRDLEGQELVDKVLEVFPGAELRPREEVWEQRSLI